MALPETEFPVHGSIALLDGVFYQVRRPIILVEARIHDGPQFNRCRVMSPEAAAFAMNTGDLTVVELPPRTPEVVPAQEAIRPYPFERGRRDRVAARSSVWDDAGVAALRRRGLIFTGEEFERRLARVRRMSRRRAAEAAND